MLILLFYLEGERENMEQKVFPMTLEGKAKLEAELEEIKVNKRI